ncbi:MAG: calycin-like domain-containing protein [Prevotella sp.]|nr:calycin-like domain-containing protein [Prevotella sp.]
MKSRTLLTYLFLPALLFGFASCSDDDEDNTVAWANIAGSYSGYISADIKYSDVPLVYDGETLTIKVNDNGTVDMHLDSPEFNTTVTGATVKDNSSWVISGDASCIITSPVHETTSDPYAGVVSATISKDKTDVEFVLTLPGVMGGTTVTFRNGTIPE